jgi:hypothetical protein
MNVNTELLGALEELLSNVPGYPAQDYGNRPWITRAVRAIAAAKRVSNTSLDIVITGQLDSYECTYTPAMLRSHARDIAKGRGRIAYAYVRISREYIRLCVDTVATDARPSETICTAL